MAIVSGKAFTLGRAKLEGTIVETIREWALAFPGDLAAFDAQQRQERANLYKRNGVSPTGNLRRVGEIPTRLANMISRRIGNKDWLFDPQTREIFYQNFKVGIVGQGGRMNYERT